MSHLGEDKLLFAFIKDNLNVPNNKLILFQKNKINLIWNDHRERTPIQNIQKNAVCVLQFYERGRALKWLKWL